MQYSSDWWKYTASAAAFVLAVLATVFAASGTLLTRHEVSLMIQREAPYIEDRTRLSADTEYLKQAMDDVKRLAEQHRRDVVDLHAQIAELRAQQKVSAEKPQ